MSMIEYRARRLDEVALEHATNTRGQSSHVANRSLYIDVTHRWTFIGAFLQVPPRRSSLHHTMRATSPHPSLLHPEDSHVPVVVGRRKGAW